MKVWKLLTLLLTTLVVAGCSSSSAVVNNNYDEKVDFTTYKSYKWNEKYIPGDRLALRPTILQDTQASIENVLNNSGFNHSESDEADFIVAVHARVTDVVHTDQYASAGWYQPGWHVYTGSTITNSAQGRLTIDIIDTGTEQISWRGVSSVFLRDDLSDSQLRQEIDKFVHDILKSFPPKKKKK